MRCDGPIQCACGAVKFEFDTEPAFVTVCHWLDCKKASGGEAAAFFGMPEDDFAPISGESNAFHYIAESGKGPDRDLEGFPRMIFVTSQT